MRNTQGKLKNIVKELKHTLSLARTSLPPVNMNMTQAIWNEHKVNKLAYEINELVLDLENNINGEETYYRTVFTVEVLSDRSVAHLSLRDVAHEIVYGDASGVCETFEKQISREHMRQLLEAQGSDPEFLLGEEE